MVNKYSSRRERERGGQVVFEKMELPRPRSNHVSYLKKRRDIRYSIANSLFGAGRLPDVSGRT